MSFLEIRQLSKTYPHTEAPCVDGFELGLERGQVCVLLGESGCGKSTLLKMVAGLEEADAGEICIDGEPMGGIAPEKRPVAMVFQKALLFPRMTVEQNVNFAPRVNRTMAKEELARATEDMLELVGLAGMGKKKATELSGGQEQRVSLARALMVHPKLLLLDEPLSALDATLRETMQRHIRRINRETHVTMLMVTHDQREAVAVADRIAVMHGGRVVQYDAPEAFYTRPATPYVAGFFGWKNLVPARFAGTCVECALGRFSVAGAAGAPRDGLLAIRPEAAVCMDAEGAGATAGEGGAGGAAAVEAAAAIADAGMRANPVAARLLSVACEGVSARCELACGTGREVRLSLSLPMNAVGGLPEGSELRLALDPARMCFIDAADSVSGADGASVPAAE